jgi:hypothetical protein
VEAQTVSVDEQLPMTVARVDDLADHLRAAAALSR